MKQFLNSFYFFLFLVPAVAAQIPTAINVQILKAEDARRYDRTLEDLLKNSNEQIRVRAALAAGRIGNETAIPALVNLLESDGSSRVREVAAFALGEIESINSADAIIRGLKKDPQPAEARLVEAAGKIAGANAALAKTTELREVILDTLERDKLSRETIMLGLTAALRAAPRDAKRERPDRTDIVVAKFLTNPDPRVRADAGNTLTRIRSKNANEVLRRMLAADNDPIARANAARALGAADDKIAVDTLIPTATGDRDPRVRVAAIRALATLRDAKAAEPLLRRAQVLFAAYKVAKKANFIPAEHSEFLEIAIALGRLMTNTRDERAVDLFRQFGKLDRGASTEVYIARLRIAPGPGDDVAKPELTNWRQYSTLAQIVGEFATLEPTNEEGKKMKGEAPGVLQPLAKAYAEADPVKDAVTIKAAPDVLRAYAGFKSADLAEILRSALKNRDVFIRATAAELLAELPASPENVKALDDALLEAPGTDNHDNDAILSLLDALNKLAPKSLSSFAAIFTLADDFVVRQRALKYVREADPERKSIPARLVEDQWKNGALTVSTYYDGPRKLGQVLNTDADYHRAASRKNGTIRAVLTTEKGTFTIDFLPEDAPLTVDNFIKLARSKYFNGLEVHRVVPNFVMQDGDPRGDGNGGPGWSIRCEMNMVAYDRGAVGMALSGKDTGGSQWFVTHSPQPHLDGGYTVFGRVNEAGMKVVDKIVRGDKIISVRIIGK